MTSATMIGYFVGVLPITCIVGILYALFRYVYLVKKQIKSKRSTEIIRFLFVCYLTGLFNLLIVPLGIWTNIFDGIFFGWWEEMKPLFQLGDVNLVPTLVKYLHGEVTLGSWVKQMLVGNILMFMPFGFFLPFVTNKVRKSNIALLAAIIPLVFELLQLILGRAFDTDDLICNFLGIVAGWFTALLVKRVFKIRELS